MCLPAIDDKGGMLDDEIEYYDSLSEAYAALVKWTSPLKSEKVWNVVWPKYENSL